MITVNGEKVEKFPKTLGEYLTSVGYDTRTIAVEFNGEIAPKENYDTISLSEGDKIEIVCFMGGGSR